MAGMGGLHNRRHELFLREYLNNGWNGKEAYTVVYGPVKSAAVQAYKLLRKPRVKRRFENMLKKLIKRADITEERILSQYQEAYDLAREQGKTADMIGASTAQAKLVGLLRERVEHGQPGEFEHLDSISAVLEELGNQAGPEIALKIGQALGLTQEQEAQPQLEERDIAALVEAEPPSGSVN